MDFELIKPEDKAYAEECFKDLYQDKIIPAEKKPYVADLRHSFGPYLGIKTREGKTRYILDAASQIATLGFGFNPISFFGPAHHLDSYLEDQYSKEFAELKNSYLQFFKRILNRKNFALNFCHSGAEANELALGDAYLKRKNKKQNKVLAFEGSFHGRMQITLSSTWNKSKRAPFEWPDFLTTFLPYPEEKNGEIKKAAPQGWLEFWDEYAISEITIPPSFEKLCKSDASLAEEIEVLTKVHSELKKQEFFCVMIEPMQCEGGDRYSTSRFHQALVLLCRHNQVRIIYDEVQTGFHLGREFFWHQELGLNQFEGVDLSPDYIVCAKKAQVGLCISRQKIRRRFSEYANSSAIRGYYHAFMLDQHHDDILALEKEAKPHLLSLVSAFNEFVEFPRTQGLAFSFDFKDAKHSNMMVEKRFNYGLLFYPAGDKTLRFRLNLAFKKQDLELLFKSLHALCSEVLLGKSFTQVKTKISAKNLESFYHMQESLIATRFSSEKEDSKQSFKQLQSFFSNNFKLELVKFSKENINKYIGQIAKLQVEVYEPERQTEKEKFIRAVSDKNSHCYGLLDIKQKLVAISFSGPLSLFPEDRGLKKLAQFSDKKSFYMLDTTVANNYQGQGLGIYLKYALTQMTLRSGLKDLWGRNRDRLAKKMLEINLSLGAYEYLHMREDYDDEEKYRSVYIYKLPLQTKNAKFSLKSGRFHHFGKSDLDQTFINKCLPSLVNKVCLSNFISADLVSAIKTCSSFYPKELKHHYLTSGQSECLDKIVKSIWAKDKKSNHLLSFKNHFFGDGSFLGRSIDLLHPPLFPSTKLEAPTEENYEQVLLQLEEKLKMQSYLGIFIEPISSITLKKTPYKFLQELKRLAQQYAVPVVYNETSSSFYRYGDSFYASGDPSITPDAMMNYYGGQAGFIGLNSHYFMETPLMLISTWDGDEFSFLRQEQALTFFEKNKKNNFKLIAEFEQTLRRILKPYKIHSLEINRGAGSFKGVLPFRLQKFFIKRDHYFCFSPNLFEMKLFIEESKKAEQ
jgi:4-aminobutyrate aminotransferase-like enzyme